MIGLISSQKLKILERRLFLRFAPFCYRIAIVLFELMRDLLHNALSELCPGLTSMGHPFVTQVEAQHAGNPVLLEKVQCFYWHMQETIVPTLSPKRYSEIGGGQKPFIPEVHLL